ncbi:phage transcriptional regulator, AlpA [mine drainage metagenome]|uniref:Phage transcriptional regulator, AlpA n=1 Tax=mine drainage metagenome TaxID=410659 RepID=T0ZUP3_9ZZZZ
MNEIALWRLPEVLRATGLNKTRLYNLQRAGQFPGSVKISERAVAWPEGEVHDWIAARIAARDAKAGA